MDTIRAFLQDESGATAIEYCLIASLISVVVIVGAISLGVSLHELFMDKIVGALNRALPF